MAQGLQTSYNGGENRRNLAHLRFCYQEAAFMKHAFHRPLTPLLILLVLSLGMAVALGAQDKDQDQRPDSLFIDRVDINLINVETFVTDKDGLPVRDLTVDDFEVFEDGVPVELSNFYSVAQEDHLLARLNEDRAMITGEAVPPAERPNEQQLSLLVYVDHFNLHARNQQRVLAELKGFIEDRIEQGDQIMLVGYNRKINVVQPLTRDRERLFAGLRELDKASTYREMDDSRRRQTMRNMRPLPRTPDGGAAAAFELLRSYVVESRQELRHSLSALSNVVRSLAGLPGRKAVLYVSDGLPKRPGEDLYVHYQSVFSQGTLSGDVSARRLDPLIEAAGEDETHLFNQVVRHANAHQVTLYTLDARGTTADSTISAEYEDLGGGAAGHTTVDQLRAFNLQEPLIDMAEATGGASILNTFNFAGAFDRIASGLDSFYSLAYRSKYGGDGGYHKIEVRVKRPGLKVRHRTGYVDKPEGERIADRTFSSLLLELEANPLGVALDFGEPTKEGRDKYHLPLLVRVPFDQLTLLPSGSMEQGRLKIFLVVQDEEGRISDLQEIPYPLEIPRDQAEKAQGREVGYSTKLLLRSGIPKIAVAVWDELSGTESYVHKSVLVGAPKKGTKITRTASS